MNRSTALAFAAGLGLGATITAFAMRDYANTQTRNALAEVLAKSTGISGVQFGDMESFMGMARDMTGMTDEEFKAAIAKRANAMPSTPAEPTH
jgi:hypothetical protein